MLWALHRGEPMNRIERRNQKRSRLIKKVKVILYSFLFMILLALISYAAIVFGGRFVVDDEKLLLDTTTTIETKDGKVIGRLYNENRMLTTLEEVPQHVKDAFIAIEDRRFYEHSGVDVRSVFRAVYKDILAMSKVEGASTITQQLAKNLFLTHEKTWLRKTKEIMAAIYLENTLSKDRILELYLNEIYFGHGIYGIDTAADYYFSKDVKDLSISEGAMLAGLVKAPNGYSPIKHPEKAKSRRNTVLRAMDEVGAISAKQRAQVEGKDLALTVNKWKPDPSWSSYTDFVMKEAAATHHLSIDELKRGGYRLIVNMDTDTQRIAYEQFQNDAFFPGSTKETQGAFAMMKQKTGQIVSVIGGRNFEFGDMNQAMVARQPGSTFKPLAVYGPALMGKKYQPYSLIPDKKIEYDGYTAKNYDDSYEGVVSIYEAIIHSKNAPAVWLLNEIGVNYAKEYLSKLHLPIDDKGLAIALGGLKTGVSPVDLMKSYSSFAHQGKIVTATSIHRILDQSGDELYKAKVKTEKVFTPQVAWDMTEMLEEAVKNGTASAGNYEKALAGKTGSTQHPKVEGKVKDAWFAGYTPQYVMASWIGYDTVDKKSYLTGGSTYPTKLVKAILTEMDRLHPLEEAFSKPKEVTALPKPITLPEIKNVKAAYAFGNISILGVKLTWEGSKDERVIYRIYREEEGVDKRIGEVEGKTEFIIEDVMFNTNEYYVVPYDPLTKTEGTPSETVRLAW